MSSFNNFLSSLNPETANAVGNFYGTGTGIYSSIDAGGYMGMDPRENPGDKLYADIIRAQTRDYMTRFAPVEEDLVSRITRTGTTSLEGDLDRTRQAVLGAGLNVQGQQNRGMERLGMSGNSAIGTSNATVGALVGGLNDTRMRDTDRRNELLTGVGGVSAQRARGT